MLNMHHIRVNRSDSAIRRGNAEQKIIAGWTRMKVGFIGLGIMGKPMSKNLIKAGYSLVVNDVNGATVAELAALGAEAAGNARELTEKVDVVITMLPNSPHVKQVVLGRTESSRRRGPAWRSST
jgi:3-hydroxyisobutyrate dehydrogenase-like beta-hydroxyacid dehydrogenase